MNIGWALFPSDSDRRKHRLHKEGEGEEGQVAAHPQSNPAMDSSVMAEELRSWQSLVSLWDRCLLSFSARYLLFCLHHVLLPPRRLFTAWLQC